MNTEQDNNETEFGTAKLSKDLQAIVGSMTQNQARLLVDTYYSMQEKRKRESNQVSASTKFAEPHAVLDWFLSQSVNLEKQVALALKRYAESRHMGRWAMSQVGIGPVISAGLCAHIDMSKVQTAGAIWRFAGLDNTVIWPSEQVAKAWIETNGMDVSKAETYFGRHPGTLMNYVEGKLTKDKLVKALMRRPWNASLRTLCWKIGESFNKVRNNKDAFYGRILSERQELETTKNNAGEYREQALRIATERPTHAQISTYKEGMLPKGHILSRAKRYATKLFLSHWFEEAYLHEFGKEPPLPYPIAILGHAHKIDAPK